MSATEVREGLGKVTWEQRSGGVGGGWGLQVEGRVRMKAQVVPPGEPRSCRARWRVRWAEVSGRGKVAPWGILRGFVFTLIKIGARMSQHGRDLSRGSSLSWAPSGEVGAWDTQDGVTTGVRGVMGLGQGRGLGGGTWAG